MEIAQAIPLLLDILEEVDPEAYDDFVEQYEGELSLAGDEWEDFCNQPCGTYFLEELYDKLYEYEDIINMAYIDDIASCAMSF